MSSDFKIKILQQENGKLRQKCNMYADKYEYLGGKTLLAECNKWKSKYKSLLALKKKDKEGRKMDAIKKENMEMHTELAHYKNIYYDLDEKYKRIIREEIDYKDKKQQLDTRLNQLSRNCLNLSTKNSKLRDEIEQLKLELDVSNAEVIKMKNGLIFNMNKVEEYSMKMNEMKNNEPDSYGYNSMDACIEDMKSDNPEYPFTEQEKEKILNDAIKMEEKEEKLTEDFKKVSEEILDEAEKDFNDATNNEYVEEKVKNKEDEYLYTATTKIPDEWENRWEPDQVDESELVDEALQNKQFLKRVRQSIRKKHKELYKKHKVIVEINSVEKYDNLKLEYTYTLTLETKPIKKNKITIEEN